MVAPGEGQVAIVQPDLAIGNRQTLDISGLKFQDWNGNGTFQDGETSDYLLRVEGDFGDAPEGVIAYPATGMFGQFPTCMSVGPSGFVSHRSSGTMMLGPQVDLEADGNAGFCPLFPPYDSDECWGDGDDGLIMPGSYRIDQGMNVVTCPGNTIILSFQPLSSGFAGITPGIRKGLTAGLPPIAPSALASL